jgi:2-isopropylmalate synthase
MQDVKVYDTTLRDGTQAEDFSLSMEDKVRISLKLDELGIHYIEGGWPGSNPKDVDFFNEIRNYQLKNARIAAFGSTHHHGKTASTDENLKALLSAKTPVVTIFGKSWTVHVRDALHTTLERNLELIRDSLAFLRPRVETLFYDAEHFFDGFKENPEYALSTLGKAVEGGAECIILCDTNGGNLPGFIREAMETVKTRFPDVPLGIHAHNDAELAVANSLAAVEMGAAQVQKRQPRLHHSQSLPQNGDTLPVTRKPSQTAWCQPFHHGTGQCPATSLPALCGEERFRTQRGSPHQRC